MSRPHLSSRPDDFREQYIKLSKSLRDYEIAKRLFVSNKTLYRWKKAVGIFEERKGFGIMNDGELKLAKRIAEALGMELIQVQNTEFIKLLEKMVVKLEEERNRVDVLPTICVATESSDVDIDKIIKNYDASSLYPSIISTPQEMKVEKLGMTFNEYQEMSKRTMPLNNSFARTNYALGLAGEVGEVVDMIKKVIFHHHEMNKLELKKELGDVLHYLSGLATLYDLRLEDVATANILKLQKRYPKGFSVEDSKKRVDACEHTQYVTISNNPPTFTCSDCGWQWIKNVESYMYGKMGDSRRVNQRQGEQRREHRE